MTILVLALISILGLTVLAHVTKSSAYPVAISWIAGAAGFGLLYTGYLNNVADLIAVASVTSLGALPFLSEEKGPRSFLFGAIPALSFLCLAFFVGEISAPDSTTGIIFVAAFASAMLGALACLSAASSFSEDGFPTSWMLGIVGGVAGIFLAGKGRSSIPNSEYGFSIRGPDGPVQYVLEGFRGLENGVSWAVSSPMPNLELAWIILGLIALIGGLLVFPHPLAEKVRKGSVLLLGCGVAIIAAYLPALISNLGLPDSSVYKDYAQQFLIGKRLPGQAAEDAVFTNTNGLSVSFVDILPELWTLSFACIAVLAFLISRYLTKTLVPKTETSEEVSAGSHDRYRLMIRGSIWFWLAWFIAQVLHRSMYGTPGVGSSNEWVFLGGALFLTGLSLLSDHKVGRSWLNRVSGLTPGLGLAIIFLLLGVAARFNTILGLSITVF